MIPTPEDPVVDTVGALSVTVYNDDARAAVVSVAGEVDAASVETLRKELDAIADAGATTLVLDLTGVRFFDSSGLAALVSARRRLRSRGGGVALVCGEGMVLRVLRLTGLDKVMSIFATREEALAGDFAG